MKRKSSVEQFYLSDYIAQTLSYFVPLSACEVLLNYGSHMSIKIVKHKLSSFVNNNSFDQNMLDMLLQRQEDVSRYQHPSFSLFKYQNEKDAFEYGLNLKGSLSYYDVRKIWELSYCEKPFMKKLFKKYSDSDIQASYGGTTAHICSLNNGTSIKGLYEIVTTEHEKKWFVLGNNNGYTYAIYPKPNIKNLTALINAYNQDMTKLTQREALLKRIIQFSSDLTRMHYFRNANKRTSFIILNCELVKHGFLPTFIEDRGLIRILGQDEIYVEVLKGMQACWEHLSKISESDIDITLDQAFKMENQRVKQPVFINQAPGSLNKDKNKRSIDDVNYNDTMSGSRKKPKHI